MRAYHNNGNCVEVVNKDHTVRLLFSYGLHVGTYINEGDKQKFQTLVSPSVTTSKHINSWIRDLPGAKKILREIVNELDEVTISC